MPSNILEIVLLKLGLSFEFFSSKSKTSFWINFQKPLLETWTWFEVRWKIESLGYAYPTHTERWSYVPRSWKLISIEPICYVALNKFSEVAIGHMDLIRCALESWESGLSNAYRMVVVSILLASLCPTKLEVDFFRTHLLAMQLWTNFQKQLLEIWTKRCVGKLRVRAIQRTPNGSRIHLARFSMSPDSPRSWNVFEKGEWTRQRWKTCEIEQWIKWAETKPEKSLE